MSGAGRRAVAIGGGTGLPRVLTALLSLEYEPVAVVTMADDGDNYYNEGNLSYVCASWAPILGFAGIASAVTFASKWGMVEKLHTSLLAPLIIESSTSFH